MFCVVFLLDWNLLKENSGFIFFFNIGSSSTGRLQLKWALTSGGSRAIPCRLPTWLQHPVRGVMLGRYLSPAMYADIAASQLPFSTLIAQNLEAMAGLWLPWQAFYTNFYLCWNFIVMTMKWAVHIQVPMNCIASSHLELQLFWLYDYLRGYHFHCTNSVKNLHAKAWFCCADFQSHTYSIFAMVDPVLTGIDNPVTMLKLESKRKTTTCKSHSAVQACENNWSWSGLLLTPGTFRSSFSV